MPPLPPRTLRICQKQSILGKFEGFQGGEEASPPPIFFSQILFNLLQHVFGRFSNLTTLETFHMDIAHIYRGISGLKQWCVRARARALQNTIFAIFHLYGSHLGYHIMKHAFVENHPTLMCMYFPNIVSVLFAGKAGRYSDISVHLDVY